MLIINNCYIDRMKYYVGQCWVGCRIWSNGGCIGIGISNISDRNQEVQEAGPRRQPIYHGGASVRGRSAEVARE